VHRRAVLEEQALTILQALPPQQPFDAVDSRRGDLDRLTEDGLAVRVANEHPVLSGAHERPVDGDARGPEDDDEQAGEDEEHEREHHLDRRRLGLLLGALTALHAHLFSLLAVKGFLPFGIIFC